jgi:hypothetical protein
MSLLFNSRSSKELFKSILFKSILFKSFPSPLVVGMAPSICVIVCIWSISEGGLFGMINGVGARDTEGIIPSVDIIPPTAVEGGEFSSRL